MRIAELAVKNPQFTLVVFALLAALGVNAFMTIPRSEDPQFPIPGFIIVAVYPGAAPIDVEELIAGPIEESLDTLDDIKKLNSTIAESVAAVRIEFESGVDVDKKEQEVRRQIAAVRAELPSDLLSLDVTRFATSNVSLVQLAVVSEGAPWSVLETLTEDLEKRLEAAPGIKDATVHGLPEREVRITLDLEKLALQQIPLDQVFQALASDNQTIPGGNVDLAGRRLGIKTSGAFRSLEQVRQTVVAGDGQSVVHLGEVAEVTWATAPNEVRTRYAGQRALFVTATQKEGQNVFAIRAGVEQVLAEWTRTLPRGVHVERGFDQAENVAMRLDRLYEDFAIAIGLVLVTLLPLGLRAAGVVMVAIPLSLAIGLSLMQVLGYNLNQLSIVGFVIALGLLVDDAIVVVENIERFLREGHSRREAAVLATQQIAVAVLGCTATLIFAFVPMLFLPGGPGDFIRSLPMAVVTTIVGSLIVALTIIPFLASQVLRPSKSSHGNVFLRAMTQGIEWTFRPVLALALRHKLLSLLLAAGLVAGSVALVPKIGFSLFPKAGTRQFLVKIDAPEGASIDQTDSLVSEVEAVLARRPEIAWTMANVGKGNPQAYYNIPPHPESSSYGEIFAELTSYDPTSSPALLEALRQELSGWPGTRIEVKEFENGPPIDAPIGIRLYGDDLASLTRAAAQVEQLLKQTPGTTYVHNPYRAQRTDLTAEVDRDKAGMLGVPTIQIARLVRLAVAGLSAGTFRTEAGDERDLAVVLGGYCLSPVAVPGDAARWRRQGPAVLSRVPPARSFRSSEPFLALERHRRAPLGPKDNSHRCGGRNGLDSLGLLEIPTVTGTTVRFSDVASLGFHRSPTTIQHYGAKQRAVTVTASVAAGENVDRTTKAILAALETTTLPDGTRWEAAGEVESRKESFGGLGAAILVATFMILAILVLEFKTFRGTLVVASVIPLGVMGGLVALYWTGYTLSFTAVVGFIALIGIEIKTSILLVDFTNQLRAEGMAVLDAVKKAGEVRFLPILLTTLTAIGGLLPLALQASSLYSPLAWVIIGGLCSSTFLARVVTPVLYVLLAPKDSAEQNTPVDAALIPA